MDQDITAILLPVSSVDIFAVDDGTAASAEKLAEDWRFARVNITVTRDGMDGAIAKYSQQASPELIIIETNDISDAFIARLGDLAGVCAEGTDAVIIGPTNDVHLYRNLVGMGVRDYLVRPVAEHDMINVIAKALVEKRGIASSRLVAVMGAKGGVGCTSVSQMLGWLISEKMGEKTLVMDLSGSSGTLSIGFGVEPSASLTEALRAGTSGSDDDMRRIVQPAGDNLSLLVSGGDPILSEAPDTDAAEALTDRVMKTWPIVIADLSGCAPMVQKRILSRAVRVVVVSTPLLPALRNCRTMMNEIKTTRGSLKEVSLVLNMIGIAGKDEVPAADIKAALDLEPAARIDFNPKVFAGGEAAGKPACATKSGESIATDLTPLAALLSGAEKPSAKDSAKKEDALGFLKKLVKK